MNVKYFKDTDTALLEFSDAVVDETREVIENVYTIELPSLQAKRGLTNPSEITPTARSSDFGEVVSSLSFTYKSSY